MVLLQSLVLAALLLWAGRSRIKKHAGLCYGLATLISLAVIAAVWSGALPDSRWFFPVFTQGGLACALFIAVMFASAVPNGSGFMRTVMPIRGELSILASILTLGHNIAFGRTYFVRLFRGASMPGNVLAAAICSLLMIAIMLPLFITSFKRVRRRMKPGSWKRLQRLAYVFYGLMYIHVLLLNLPGARTSAAAQCNVIVYSVVFLTYACMRIRKALLRRNRRLPARLLPAAGMLCFVLLCCFMWIPSPSPAAEAMDSAYRDGVYTGAGVGYNGRMTVSVTIEGGEIADIKVTSAVDDAPYFDNAVDAILPAVLEAQSAEVDAASSATYSSAGLKEAIANALAGAQKGEAP